jgi:hypothetical protein
MKEKRAMSVTFVGYGFKVEKAMFLS